MKMSRTDLAYLEFTQLLQSVEFSSIEELKKLGLEKEIKRKVGESDIEYFIQVSTQLCRDSDARLFILRKDITHEDIEVLGARLFTIVPGRKDAFYMMNGFFKAIFIVRDEK